MTDREPNDPGGPGAGGRSGQFGLIGSVLRDTRVIVVLSAFGVLALALVFEAGLRIGDWGFDIRAYWSVPLERPYDKLVGEFGAFNYAPPIALLLQPARLLSFEQFKIVWLALQLVALAWMARRYTLVLLLYLPVVVELFNGNMHLLLAAAIVLGFRYPAAWALVLLTKVTPGVGLLWFVARGEWRSLGIALAATAAVSALSAVFVPDLWPQWLGLLASNQSSHAAVVTIAIPLPLRLAAASALVLYGARTDRRWTVPVAAMVALPVFWVNGLAMLVALAPILPADLAGSRRRTSEGQLGTSLQSR
jgi:hypothetical protein